MSTICTKAPQHPLLLRDEKHLMISTIKTFQFKRFSVFPVAPLPINTGEEEVKFSME